MTLSDLERRDASGQILQTNLLNTARIPLEENDHIWYRITLVGRGVTRGQPRPYDKGAVPQRSPILEFLSIYTYILCCRITKFDMVTHVAEGHVS